MKLLNYNLCEYSKKLIENDDGSLPVSPVSGNADIGSESHRRGLTSETRRVKSGFEFLEIRRNMMLIPLE